MERSRMTGEGQALKKASTLLFRSKHKLEQKWTVRRNNLATMNMVFHHKRFSVFQHEG